MQLKNISKMLIVLADHSAYYGSLKPGDAIDLSDDIAGKDCVSRPIRDGILKVIKGAVKTAAPVAAPAAPKTIKDFVSGVLSSEEATINDEESISGVTEGLDVLPNTRMIAKKAKPGVTDAGQLLVRGKRGRKKLIQVAEVATKVPKPRPKFIKTVGDGGSVALDSGDMGTMVINESGIPGQARMVGIGELDEKDFRAIATLTNDVLAQAAKDRKLAIYMTGDEEVRAKFIENSTDLDFLKQIAGMEWSGKLAKNVRAKVKEIEGDQDEQS